MIVMKYFFRSLILGALILALFAGSLLAQKASIIAENANLRDLPSNTGKVVTVLPKATEIVVLNQSGGWFQVQSGKITGWAHGSTISSIEYDDDALGNCASSVTTIRDRMTDRVMTVGLGKIIVSPDSRTGFAISLFTLSQSITLSIQYAQAGTSSCIDKDAPIYVLFTDDTKITLRNGGFNCDQKATAYVFPQYNQDIINSLATKKIQAMRVTAMRNSVERDFSPRNASLFRDQFHCLVKSLEKSPPEPYEIIIVPTHRRTAWQSLP